MMKLREIYNNKVEEKDDSLLEYRLFLSSIVVGIIMVILSTVIGAIISLPFFLLLAGILITLYLFVIYYFVKFKKIFKPFIPPTIIIGILGISAIWIFSGGINGETISIGMVILILSLLIVRKKRRILVLFMFLIVIVIIYLIQLYKPEIIINYSSEVLRWADSLLTTIYCSVFIYFILLFLLENYNFEKKRAEEGKQSLIQLNADKDHFISILSHDLRSPFNGILGLTTLLKENIREFDISEIEKQVNYLNESAHNTYSLLEELLLWARSQQGKIPFILKYLNLKDICGDIVENFKQPAGLKKITINYSAEQEIMVFADSDMIKTILRNLVANAIKFTGNGGMIKITAKQSNSFVTVSVSDSGIGIKPEIMKKLFDISQVYSTKGTEDEGGTGLGLILCKDFVEKHGGKIWAESIPGKGSDFIFTLPVMSEPSTK